MIFDEFWKIILYINFCHISSRKSFTFQLVREFSRVWEKLEGIEMHRTCIHVFAMELKYSNRYI